MKDLRKASDRLEILSGKISFLAKEHQSFTGSDMESPFDYSEIIEQAKETLNSKMIQEEAEQESETVNTEEVTDNQQMVSSSEDELAGTEETKITC